MKEVIMKNITSTFVATFILVLITLSCDDDDPVSVKDKLVGEWFWVQSTGGWTGGTITPDSVGYSIILSFEEDGTYRKFQNDTLVFICSYTIERKEYNTELRDFLIIEDPDQMPPYCYQVDQVIEFETANTLKLIENCFDCYVHTYLKQIDEFPTY